MSLVATRMVKERSTTTKMARLVLLEFASFASDAGRCWPSAARIAKNCNCSHRTAQRWVAHLVEAGELVQVGQKRRNVVEYQIAACLPNQPNKPATYDSPDVGDQQNEPATYDSSDVGQATYDNTDVRQNNATYDSPDARPTTLLSYQSSLEPLLEPSLREEEGARAREAFDQFNRLAEEVGLTPVQRLTARRRELLEARLSECGGLVGWQNVLARIRGSPGLLGQNENGWKLRFDWMLDETHFAQLAEGTYDSWGNNANNGSGRRQSPQEKLVAGFARAAARPARGQH